MTAQTTGLAILCLEDNSFVRTTVATVLRAHDVEFVEHVASARKKMEQRHYAAWIFDVRLDDGTGLELLQWARVRGDHTPALIMTGMDERSLANSAQELGAEFLYKPFSKSALEGFVERAGATQRRSVSVRAAAERLAQRYRVPRREQEIIEALTRGVARTELSAELGVSENTMKTYIRRLLLRTELDSLDDILRAVLRDEC